MWIDEPSFKDFVTNSWPKSCDTLQNKLHQFSLLTKNWIFNNIGDLFKKKRKILARLAGTQKALEEDPQNPFLFYLEVSLQTDLDSFLDQEEKFWHVRSRENWITKGDRNTRFFHLTATINKGINRINSLNNDVGESFSSQEDIHNLVVNYFSDLYTSSLTSSQWNRTQSSSFECDSIPTASEIKDALFAIGAQKAPGKDGYHALFLQQFWEILSSDCISMVQSVFSNKSVDPALNETILTLIPKINNPEKVNNFRPIGLANTSYKLIAKILVNKIRPLIMDLISPNQNSFIPKRGTDVNYIIASEILHSLNKMKGKKMLLCSKNRFRKGL